MPASVLYGVRSIDSKLKIVASSRDGTLAHARRAVAIGVAEFMSAAQRASVCPRFADPQRPDTAFFSFLSAKDAQEPLGIGDGLAVWPLSPTVAQMLLGPLAELSPI